MREHKRIDYHVGPGLYFYIVNQTHRGDQFGNGHELLPERAEEVDGECFFASNGVVLCSSTYPEFPEDMDDIVRRFKNDYLIANIKIVLFLAGSQEEDDGNEIEFPNSRDMDLCLEAIKEYNTYYSNYDWSFTDMKGAFR